ncbi:MAG: hypothetical protein V4733_11000 [Verrucomicrobiota bacterium]
MIVTLLQIEGVLLMILALIHIPFPWYFKWKTDLAACSPFNRQMLKVHCFFIALVVFLMGLLCVTSAAELVSTPLGRKVSAGLFVFWLCRLIIQFFGYSTELWRGKRFETSMHILFACLWMALTATFGWAAYGRS